MIVCHCNRIDHREIERAADQLSAVDEWQLITPIAVYRSLGKRPRCGGCLPLATNIIYARNVCASSAACGVCPFASSEDLAATSDDCATMSPDLLQAAE